MSTGDELVQGSSQLKPGQIRDSNRHSIKALLEEIGAEIIDLGLIPDDEKAIESALLSAVEKCDAVVTSGGVSMGDFDYVKVVLDRLGEMKWMQVAIKPAKPLAFGLLNDVPIFGLPGKPKIGTSLSKPKASGLAGLIATCIHFISPKRSSTTLT
jgi:molybdenum cofactor synthesis domain-containing protein